MIKIKTITMKNFLSFGNATQAIDVSIDGLTLILGNNLDLGGAGNKNGSGKTSLIQAISYGLFGQPLTNIKKDNLVNSVNGKGMLVTVDYTIGDKSYRIERGRKPNVLRFYVDDGLVTEPNTDESHGESKWTQQEIEKTLNLSHTMFKNIVVLHTKTTPFLNLSEKNQRDIIEELMGITQLSRKAEKLKEQIKDTKGKIRDQEVKIETILESNKKIQTHIDRLKNDAKRWDQNHNKKLETIATDIVTLEHIDIDEEISNHEKLTIWKKLESELKQSAKDCETLEKAMSDYDRQIKKIAHNIETVHNNTCPTCKQELHDGDDILKNLQTQLEEVVNNRKVLQPELETLVKELEDKAKEFEEMGEKPSTHYIRITDAYEHKGNLEKKIIELENEYSQNNPYNNQIENLNTSSIQEVSYEYIEELISLKEHQDFLLKLLINKDSFIRRKIIDQNLSLLNVRLNEYLGKLLLPHEVIFNSDLSVTITNRGKEYDFDQLSNGESNRVILSLSWAFRDVWENLNQSLNLAVIDELVDSGLDNQGTDASLSVLKNMAHDKGKNVFLISHKDGLETRVDNVLTVQKESGFSSFELSN